MAAPLEWFRVGPLDRTHALFNQREEARSHRRPRSPHMPEGL